MPSLDELLSYLQLHQAVQAAAAETFEIERDELEAECAELFRQLIADFGSREMGDFRERHFDAGQFPFVEAHAALAQTQRTEIGFGGFDTRRPFRCHRQARGQPTGKARRGGFIPGG